MGMTQSRNERMTNLYEQMNSESLEALSHALGFYGDYLDDEAAAFRVNLQAIPPFSNPVFTLADAARAYMEHILAKL
jgi:hypothetical protein